jgi:hypothetical protein
LPLADCCEDSANGFVAVEKSRSTHPVVLRDGRQRDVAIAAGLARVGFITKVKKGTKV